MHAFSQGRNIWNHCWYYSNYIQKYKITDKAVSFCGDNTHTNFNMPLHSTIHLTIFSHLHSLCYWATNEENTGYKTLLLHGNICILLLYPEAGRRIKMCEPVTCISDFGRGFGLVSRFIGSSPGGTTINYNTFILTVTITLHNYEE
jgi:hypothetical protein